MKEIAQEITAATKGTHVLKGGAALLLGYKSTRFTQDMDFDAKQAVSLEAPIRRAAEKILEMLRCSIHIGGMEWIAATRSLCLSVAASQE